MCLRFLTPLTCWLQSCQGIPCCLWVVISSLSVTMILYNFFFFEDGEEKSSIVLPFAAYATAWSGGEVSKRDAWKIFCLCCEVLKWITMNKVRLGIAHEQETSGTEKGHRKQDWSQLQVIPAAWANSVDELMCTTAQGNKVLSLVSPNVEEKHPWDQHGE